MEVTTKCTDYNCKSSSEGKIEEDFPNNLEKSVNNIIVKEGFKTYNVFKRQISTDGGNYLGILYEVDVTGKTDDGDKETNIFIKKIIPDENMKVMSVSEAYRKELFAYNELSKIFTELQNSAEVPLDKRFKMVKSFDESSTELIFLENLSRKGFKTCHRMDVMSIDFAELSIQQLARFHALSFVLQRKRPDFFNKKLRPFTQPYNLGEDWNAFIKNCVDMVIEPLSCKDKVKMISYKSKIPDKIQGYMSDTTMKGCCVCHGDYRVNNILARTERTQREKYYHFGQKTYIAGHSHPPEIITIIDNAPTTYLIGAQDLYTLRFWEGKIKEIIPVDFQLLYYGCPINDILYFIFTGSDHEFRKLHLDHLKDMYYDELDSFLSYFNMRAEEFYPRNEFEAQFEGRLEFGVLIGLMVLPFIFAEENDVPDFSKDDMKSLTVTMNVKYEERTKGFVEELKRWGYL